jgi:hypothetical protein
MAAEGGRGEGSRLLLVGYATGSGRVITATVRGDDLVTSGLSLGGGRPPRSSYGGNWILSWQLVAPLTVALGRCRVSVLGAMAIVLLLNARRKGSDLLMAVDGVAEPSVV